MKKLIHVALFALLSIPVSAIAGEMRVPETCEAIIYRTFDKALPVGQYVGEIYKNDEAPGTLIDVTLSDSQDCIKGAQVEVKYNSLGACSVVKISIDSGHFDCG